MPPNTHPTLTRPPAIKSGLWLPAVFALTLFSSAFLLFAVQPMVSRMVLPRLGGAPSVWNSCICFFQAALLLGYAYADLLVARFGRRMQLGVHAAVLALACVFLPLAIGAGEPNGVAPALWLVGRLALTIGPPFFALAATAPLLQFWFSRASHARAADPYFLYAASNAGSLIALLGYPTLIETTSGLSTQVWLWSLGFGVVVALVVLCGLASLGPADGWAAQQRRAAVAPAAPPPLAMQLRWVALAFVPSSLMLAVTSYITTDIAAAPLFWVGPLAIYILTFIFAFGWRGAQATGLIGSRVWRWLGWAQAAGLAATSVFSLQSTPSIWAMLAGLLAFAATACCCHVELAARRPPPAHLTRYFLLISAGGALGGIFNALLAPLLFNGPYEFPVMLILACLLRPQRGGTATRALAALMPGLVFGMGLLCLVVLLLLGSKLASGTMLASLAAASTFVVPFLILLWSSRRAIWLAIGIAVMFLPANIINGRSTLLAARSFFGTYRVLDWHEDGLIAFKHGTTMHGLQSTLPGERDTPFGYYERSGPFGRFFAARARVAPALRDVAVIGLGSGELACYATPDQHWRFLEIDPLVARIANDTRYFHFLQDCGAKAEIQIGDARITLTQDTQARYDVLVVDAFSSDSVPVHLLTSDALRLYFAHLNPGGVVVFHVTNRYLALVPVVARLGLDAGAQVRHLAVNALAEGLRHQGTELVVVGKPGTSLAYLAADGWDQPAPGPVLWTDERTDILRVIRW